MGGMCGWGFILYEVFAGEAGKVCADGIQNKYVKESFATMRFIVSVGWSIYPLGYFFGYLQGAVDDDTLTLSTTLQTLSTRLHSAWPSGHQPRTAPLRRRRVPSWVK